MKKYLKLSAMNSKKIAEHMNFYPALGLIENMITRVEKYDNYKSPDKEDVSYFYEVLENIPNFSFEETSRTKQMLYELSRIGNILYKKEDEFMRLTTQEKFVMREGSSF